jgi:hypothetical protein
LKYIPDGVYVWGGARLGVCLSAPAAEMLAGADGFFSLSPGLTNFGTSVNLASKQEDGAWVWVQSRGCKYRQGYGWERRPWGKNEHG